jgi:hypothetical protein
MTPYEKLESQKIEEDFKKNKTTSKKIEDDLQKKWIYSIIF